VQAELACARLAAKKEAAAVEERQADAFNEVIRQMADDLQQVRVLGLVATLIALTLTLTLTLILNLTLTLTLR
jgi:hypothetical protein